jgi:P27 family predicted phage terminase small subunit
MIQAQEQLSKSGILYKTKSGYVMQSPLLSIVNNSIEIINRLSREFGLTPASRSRLDASDPIEKQLDSIEAALCG